MPWFTVLLFLVSSTTYIRARSSCDDVQFISRDEWGANPPVAITNLTRKPFSFYVIHHTYEPASCYDDATCAQRVKSIQDFHQKDRGWDDIGYHFLVGENGKVYEGRGWDRQAAHSPGWNADSFGICIIGDFTQNSPDQKAQRAVQSWIQCGVDRGHVVPNHYVITHRQSQRPGYTVCPGDGAFNEVKHWPRWCSFQNDGTSNNSQTVVSIGREYCLNNVINNQSNRIYFSVFLAFSLVFFYSILNQ